MTFRKNIDIIKKHRDGLVCEALAKAILTAQGFIVFTPISDKGPIDMIAKHGAQPGPDMGYYEEEWKGLVIESMEFVEAGIKLTCFYETKVDWIQIKEDEFDEEHALSEALNYMLRDIDIDELSDNKEINKK